jgi:hypothetical protein
MDQLKGEKLMVVPPITDGFRAAVNALRSIDGKDDVSFHSFTLSEDRCTRRLLKNLGRGITESVANDEMEYLNYGVEGAAQVRSSVRDPQPAKESPPNTHLIVTMARGHEVPNLPLVTELCGLRVSVESYVALKTGAMQALSALRPHAA